MFGGRTLSLTVLDWPASIGIEDSSWLPYCSVKLVSKFRGACAPRLTTRLRPLSFLTSSWNSKLDFEVPRSDGSCALMVSLAGRSLASATASGSVVWFLSPFAVIVRLWLVPVAALSGTSSRNCSDVESLVATMAAATGWPPPSSVAVQPCGTPLTESANRSGSTA